MARKTAKTDVAKIDSSSLQKIVDLRKSLLLDINRIIPNSYNKNKMGSQYMAALKANMSNPNIGFTIPILVRPDPDMVPFEEGKIHPLDYIDELISNPDMKFTIIDGFHRFICSKEIGYQRIPVVILPPMAESLAKFLTLESNQIKGATSDTDIHSILDSIYSSGDKWFEEQDNSLHDLLVMDAPEENNGAYDLGDIDVENNHPTATPVTLFFSELQREKFRKIIGQLRLVNSGCTNEEAVIQVIEHFETTTGFGDQQEKED
jgi:hypothetical protein